MIIAVSSEQHDSELFVSSRFGSCKRFVLFSTNDETREVIENPYADSLGDAGIQSAQMLIERNVDVLITDHIGRNAFRVLSAANIGIYRCTVKRVKESIDLFLDGGLERVSLPSDGARRRRKRRLGRSN
jgi:predicted Fe-Mo cluster-binding NifX family protein